MTQPQAPDATLLPLIRQRVREGLLASPAYARLPEAQRAEIAHDTVRAFHYILGGADGRARPDNVMLGGNAPFAAPFADKPPLPEGDTAGQRFAQSGAVAAQQGSQSLTDMIERVDFPQFVA